MSDYERETAVLPEWYRGELALRDYFAAAALTGTLAACLISLDGKVVAESCYRFADAMMKERNRDQRQNQD